MVDGTLYEYTVSEPECLNGTRTLYEKIAAIDQAEQIAAKGTIASTVSKQLLEARRTVAARFMAEHGLAHGVYNKETTFEQMVLPVTGRYEITLGKREPVRYDPAFDTYVTSVVGTLREVGAAGSLDVNDYTTKGTKEKLASQGVNNSLFVGTAFGVLGFVAGYPFFVNQLTPRWVLADCTLLGASMSTLWYSAMMLMDRKTAWTDAKNSLKKLQGAAKANDTFLTNLDSILYPK